MGVDEVYFRSGNMTGTYSSEAPRFRAELYEKRNKKEIRCMLCGNYCIIPPRKYGICKSRINYNGELYTLTYGNLSAIESRPIEIKPFFHYWPGSTALTISTWGCNFHCPWCQNFFLSQRKPPEKYKVIQPLEVVKAALKNKDKGICVSFQEPILLFEYSLDILRLLRNVELYFCYVSNGFMSSKALRFLIENGLDGLKVDVKGDEEVYERYCGGYAERVWDNIKMAKEMGIHVEVVNLIVTGVNDREESISCVIERIKKIDSEIPLHFTRYFPAYKFDAPPTPIKIIEEAWKRAREEGIKYVYTGNIEGHRGLHTYCPQCGCLLIEREQTGLLRTYLEGNECPECGERILIRGKITLPL